LARGAFDFGGCELQLILVVGDIIVDEFIWGDVSRISPEAPGRWFPLMRLTAD